MGKLTRKQIEVMVAQVAERLPHGPKIDSATACSMLVDAIYEGQTGMSKETFGGVIGAVAFVLRIAANEFQSTIHPAGRA